MNKRKIRDILVFGGALFSVFFGGGNLIFPAYIGEKSGTSWVVGLVCFAFAATGVACATVIAIVKASEKHGPTNSESGSSFMELLSPLGKYSSTLLAVLLVLSIGPMIVIPRTCATTYSMGLHQLIPSLNQAVFSIVFFALVALFTIRKNAVVDIVGQYLTPVLLIVLAILCIKGIVSPLGPVAEPAADFTIVKTSVMFGYESMDALGGGLFCIILIKTIRDHGYVTIKQQLRVMVPSAITAFVAIFVIYCGLCYLGASTGSLGMGDLNQTDLMVKIVHLLLQNYGLVLLTTIVFFACLTTAIGLTSASAQFFHALFKEKISYNTMAIIVCIWAGLIANLGIDSIIALAGPIVNVLFPVLLTQVALTFFNDRINNVTVNRGAALGALITAILTSAADLGLAIPLIKSLPLVDFGFGWVIPAIIGGIIGAFLPKKKADAAESAPAEPEPTEPEFAEPTSAMDAEPTTAVLQQAVASPQ